MRPIARLLRAPRNTFTMPPFWSTGEPIRIAMPFLGDRERIENNFGEYIAHAYKASGPVFAVILARMLVFAEARFLWREYRDGRPGDLFDNGELGLLERPWPNATTGELLARMEQVGSLAGNAYFTTVDRRTRVRRLRPDWLTIVTGSPTDDPFHPEAQPGRVRLQDATSKDGDHLRG